MYTAAVISAWSWAVAAVDNVKDFFTDNKNDLSGDDFGNAANSGYGAGREDSGWESTSGGFVGL
jgi:hypothetical protein